MKNQQHEAARELYFNSNLSKTDIAEKLSVTRRTIYQWSVDGDWEKLRQSARHMPAILAEKCAYLIGHFADHLLSADSQEMPISKQEVDMLHKLTVTMNKLKRGTTVADNMETFTYLLERIQHQDPDLAEKVAPHVEQYIKDRRGKDDCSFLLHGFDQTGHLPYSEKEQNEHRIDQEQAAAILAEQHIQKQTPKTQQSKPNSTSTSTPHSVSHSHSNLAAVAAAKEAPSNLHSNSAQLRNHEPIRRVHTPLHPTSQLHTPAAAA